MKISCLRSVYIKDDPQFLKDAIDSIVHQTRLPDEFLIIHDGLISDEQKEIIQDYRQQYPFIRLDGYEQNKGLGYALAYGVERCKFEVIARMDSDDYSIPERFAIQERYRIEHPEIRVLGSITYEFIENTDNVVSKRIVPEDNDAIVDYSRTRNPFVHPSMFLYKDDILKVGNYESWYLCEDYDLWTKLIRAGCKCHNIQQPLTYRRISDDFYKRRGGIKYCHNILRFIKHLRKQKYRSFGQYWKRWLSTVVTALAPNFVRKFIYTKLLRK